MMRSGWKEAAIAVLFVALNAAVVFYGVGMDSEVFSWKAFAQTYVPPGTDPGSVSADPSGCFYDKATGQIIPGATIAAAGGSVTDDGASDGCYQIVVGGDPVAQLGQLAPTLTVDISVASLPIGCTVDPCAQPPVLLNVMQGQVIQVGNLPDPGNPGFLTAPGCTTFNSPILFAGGAMGSAVTANNIALICLTPPAQAPLLGTVGWVALGILLFALGWLGLRQRADEAA